MDSIRKIIRALLQENLKIDDSIETNRFVYHASNIKNNSRINKFGILPHRGKQWLSDTEIKGKAVFATNSDKLPDWFDSTFDDDVWKIDTNKIPNVKWKNDPNFSWNEKSKHIFTQDTIPRDAIELIKKGTGKDNLFETNAR